MTMTPRPHLLLAPLLGLPLLLAACTDDAATVSEDDGREASGEVLEGSISDAMLPLDEVQSQAPLAEPEAAPSGANAADESAAETPAAEPAETDEAADPAAAE